jgi:hypothetical protein
MAPAVSPAATIGWPVVYRSPGGETVEAGVVFGLNSEFVFVRYAGEHQPKATPRANLQLVPQQPNYGAAGRSLEDRARDLAREVFSGTTMDPARIEAAVEREWGYFMVLLS